MGIVGGDLRVAIDYAFQNNSTIDQILEALQGLTENKGSTAPPSVIEWAAKTRKTILQRSPTSVRVALRQLREGATWDIAETFRKEHVIASRFMEHPDVVAFFAGQPSLELLNTEGKAEDIRYKDYPHAWTGLPREREVLGYVNRNRCTMKEAVDFFVQHAGGKQGVKEKVEEILRRKADETESGALTLKR